MLLRGGQAPPLSLKALHSPVLHCMPQHLQHCAHAAPHMQNALQTARPTCCSHLPTHRGTYGPCHGPYNEPWCANTLAHKQDWQPQDSVHGQQLDHHTSKQPDIDLRRVSDSLQLELQKAREVIVVEGERSWPDETTQTVKCGRRRCGQVQGQPARSCNPLGSTLPQAE